MMTQMRQMAKIIYVIIGLAFIGLIVFEWGLDYSGSGPDTTIGEVNGQQLSYNDFNEYYKQLYQNERARTGSNPDDTRLNFLKDQVWEQFIQRTLFSEQMEKLNIAVTDSEVVYQMYNYPLQDFKQNEQLQTNSVFDINKYRQVLPTMPMDQQIALENYYRAQIPFQKLQNIITSSVRVSEMEVLDEFKNRNLKAKVDYLAIRPARFTDGVETTESEIAAYYDEHEEDYKQPEMRNLAYVLFPVLPTSADTNRLYENISEIKERLSLGEDFETLALEYSEDPSVNTNNGDLGFFDRQTMVKPFSDAAFAASPGELVGPVETVHGYHLIKVEDKKIEDGQEQVKAKHILLKISVGSSTRFEQEDKASSFAAEANDQGWQNTIEKYGYVEKFTGLFEENSAIVPGFDNNPAIANFAYVSKEETISGIFSLDEAYTVLMLKEIQEAGYKSLDDPIVKNGVTNKVKIEKAASLAHSHAQSLAEKVSLKTSFKEIADADTSNKVTYQQTSLFSINQIISGGVGKDAQFAASAFALNTGEVSGLIDSENAYYYLHLLEKTNFDSSVFIAQKEILKNQLMNQKKGQVFSSWYEKLKEESSITDNRKKFNIY